MIAIGNFRYLQTRALSFLTITCKMESQKHASRFDLRYDTYSGLWCHKPMKELGLECDFVKIGNDNPHRAGRQAGKGLRVDRITSGGQRHGKGRKGAAGEGRHEVPTRLPPGPGRKPPAL